MSSILSASLSTLALLLGVLACIEIGFRLGIRKKRRDPEAVTRGVGGMEAAVFGLVGLLIAFIFSAAAGRFEKRRELIIEESNAVGTALLRLDLLPDADRAALRPLFRQYINARLDCHHRGNEGGVAPADAKRVAELQQQIWTRANAALKAQNHAPATQLLIPALNEMFDLGAARMAGTELHSPPTVVGLLFCTVLVASVLAGYSMAARFEHAHLHMIIFALALSVTVYVTLDLELPRAGLIRVDSLDHLLTDIRDSI